MKYFDTTVDQSIANKTKSELKNNLKQKGQDSLNNAIIVNILPHIS